MDVASISSLFGSAILRRCHAILRNRQEAEDAAQEVFVLLLSKGNQFRGDAAASTWIYRVTTNVCLNRLRSDKRRRAREEADSVALWLDVAPRDPYEHYAARALLEEVSRDLDALDQEVFVLAHLDGMTQDEIADVTGKSRRTIGKRIKRLEQRFSQRLSGQLSTPVPVEVQTDDA